MQREATNDDDDDGPASLWRWLHGAIGEPSTEQRFFADAESQAEGDPLAYAAEWCWADKAEADAVEERGWSRHPGGCSGASRFFAKHPSPEGLVWWTHTGLVTAWSVSVGFSSDGRLNMARTSTEDGPYHPRGVPPDIR